jgi:hypothetical protein
VLHNRVVTSTDPLAPYSRNEPCWCSSGLKYKYCHGIHRPESSPGAPVPPDEEGSKYVSPNTRIPTSILLDSMRSGFPMTQAAPGPAPKMITFTNWEKDLTSAVADDGSVMGVEQLGGLRVEVLRRLASLPDTDDQLAPNIVRAVYELTAESVRTVAQLSRATPRPVVLWNQELDLAEFLGRTLLLADHVLFDDGVFDTLLRDGRNHDVREAARTQLANAELLNSGIAIPVPTGVAKAAHGDVVHQLTSNDLQSTALADWVRSQLIIEGPTAREALLIRAIDDLSREPANLAFYARIIPGSLNDDEGSFQSGLLMPFDPAHDYRPWIKQSEDSAVSTFVQRTNQRIVTADVFGAEYVSASMFEARLLRNRGHERRMGAAQAAIWADIPGLTTLTSPDLSRVLKNESAIADFRRQVSAALKTARTDGDNVDAITELTHQLEAASHNLQRSSRTDALWSGGVPGVSAAIAGYAGGLLAAGAAGVVGAIAPALGTRLSRRREASYLFVMARRARR